MMQVEDARNGRRAAAGTAIGKRKLAKEVAAIVKA